MHGFTRYASRGWPLLALAVMLSCAALVRGAVPGPETGTYRGQPGLTSRSPAPDHLRPLRLSGHVRGLYPGARKRFPVTVRNPGSAPVVVTLVRARVGDADAGCGGGNVRIPDERTRTLVQPRSSTKVRMDARMSSDAPDACQHGRFPLRFHARAKAPR